MVTHAPSPSGAGGSAHGRALLVVGRSSVASGFACSEVFGPKSLTVFVVLWRVGMFGLPHVSFGAGLSTPFVAVLDIALVFLVFKGDIRLT